MYDRIPCLCDDVRRALRIVQPMQLAPPFPCKRYGTGIVAGPSHTSYAHYTHALLCSCEYYYIILFSPLRL
jgi:hypothetical protein